MVLLPRIVGNARVRVRILRAESRRPASSRDEHRPLFNALSGKVTGSASAALNRAETVPGRFGLDCARWSSPSPQSVNASGVVCGRIAASALNQPEIDSDNVVAFEVMTDIYV